MNNIMAKTKQTMLNRQRNTDDLFSSESSDSDLDGSQNDCCVSFEDVDSSDDDKLQRGGSKQGQRGFKKKVVGRKSFPINVDDDDDLFDSEVESEENEDIDDDCSRSSSYSNKNDKEKKDLCANTTANGIDINMLVVGTLIIAKDSNGNKKGVHSKTAYHAKIEEPGVRGMFVISTFM